MKLLIATRNRGKLEEIRQLLSGLPIDVLSVDDLPDLPEVDEDAPTLAGNAIKKAATLHGVTGLATLADDTGLEVDALDGRPGVHSARYAGPEANPVDNRRLLLEELTGQERRTARFRCVIAFVDETGTTTFDGVCEGRIIDSERGSGGFGYDALFMPDGFDRTFAELPSGTKNGVSHRGRALRQFVEWLGSRTP